MEIWVVMDLDGTATSSTMNRFQALFCPCRRRRTEPASEPAPKTITEDAVWNCDPMPTALEQVEAQIEMPAPAPPKTFKDSVDHMAGVRDRLINDAISCAQTPAHLWISYQGVINTLHWIFSAVSDKTCDDAIDGPAFNAVIAPLNEDYYERRVFPAWRWRETKPIN